MSLFKTEAERADKAAAAEQEWTRKFLTHPATAPVTHWEYRTQLFGTGVKLVEIQKALNVLGAQGWELVTMDVERNTRIMGSPAQTVCVFKRQTHAV
jgi:hypothetical protein